MFGCWLHIFTFAVLSDIISVLFSYWLSCMKRRSCMPNPPTGTVTFLFTDIEGSTRRWEQYPQQMNAAVARHDALLRSAIEANSGYVFKTVGDAFCAAFPTAQDALQATLDAQHALYAEQWSEDTGPIRVR